jgi:hypothetical protein
MATPVEYREYLLSSAWALRRAQYERRHIELERLVRPGVLERGQLSELVVPGALAVR